MREGLIVLPTTVQAGHHTNLCNRLIDAFGGFTAVDAQGAWKDPNTGKIHNEPVIQYIVAYEPAEKQNDALRSIASWLLETTDELAVYMRYADGNVSIINRA